MKGEGVTITDLPPDTPPASPSDGVGKVIMVGDVAGTSAEQFARELATEKGVTVVVRDIGKDAARVTEGLPTTVEIQPVMRSKN